MKRNDEKSIEELIRHYSIANIKMFMAGLVCGWMSLGATILLSTLIAG